MDRDVAVRIIRQHRLTDADRPLELAVVVHEAALHHELGGPAVMRDQLLHMADASKLSTVTLQVIPLRRGGHHQPNGPFFLLSFADQEDPELLHIEHPAGSVQSEDSVEVRTARIAFEQAQTIALSPTDSVTLIERLAVELYAG